MTARQVGTLLAAGGIATGLAAHAGPALSSLAMVRRHWPTLAGLGAAGQVALTFDDGPDPASTPRFLDLLADRQVHATFFVLGRMLMASPSLASDITGAGHELAVHGWDHRNLLLRTPAATRDDMARTRDLIENLTGRTPLWWRPPYGVLSGASLSAAAQLRLRPVLWTAWARDWEARATKQSVLATAMGNLNERGTLLLHDSDCTSAPGSWRTTLAALPELLDLCDAHGWQVVPLREHLRP
jgi:peptidoglycan/xylan/chitin deacetylase (PgdA/CDA1 family)